MLTQGTEIGTGWVRTGETSGKEYVSLSLAAPEFGPRKLYANLGHAAGQETQDTFAVIQYLDTRKHPHNRGCVKRNRRQLIVAARSVILLGIRLSRDNYYPIRLPLAMPIRRAASGVRQRASRPVPYTARRETPSSAVANAQFSGGHWHR